MAHKQPECLSTFVQSPAINSLALIVHSLRMARENPPWRMWQSDQGGFSF